MWPGFRLRDLMSLYENSLLDNKFGGTVLLKVDKAKISNNLNFESNYNEYGII